MFNTFNFMAINRCCILGGPYYPTLPLYNFIHYTKPQIMHLIPSLTMCIQCSRFD